MNTHHSFQGKKGWWGGGGVENLIENSIITVFFPSAIEGFQQRGKKCFFVRSWCPSERCDGIFEIILKTNNRLIVFLYHDISGIGENWTYENETLTL